MSRPLAKDPNGNYLTVDPQSGQWRPLNDTEIGHLRPTRVLDEMGVSPTERFTIKNFLNSGTATLWLQARGYEVMNYGTGLNFAVRKSSDEPWRVVDPAKGGIGEFLRDMLDLSVGDIALPAAGAALGAAAGGPMGFFAGGAAGELARQGIGSAITGQEGNISPGGAALAGGINAALPGIGAAVKRPVTAAAAKIAGSLEKTGAIYRGAETLASRITGIKPAAGLGVYDILAYRAKTARPYGTPGDVLDVLQLHMDDVAAPTIARNVAERDTIVGDATVNVRRVIEQFVKRNPRTGEPDTDLVSRLVGRLDPERFDPDILDVQKRIIQILNPPDKSAIAAEMRALSPNGTVDPAAVQQAYRQAFDDWLVRMETMRASDALHVRHVLQDYVARHGGYEGTISGVPGAGQPLSPDAAKDIRNFLYGKRRTGGRVVREGWVPTIHSDLADQGLDAAVAADARIHTLASARDVLRHFSGTDRANAENIIRRAYEPAPPQFMGKSFIEAIKEYDAAFPGVSWRSLTDQIFTPLAARGAPGTAEGMVREAFIGSQFTPRIGRRETFGRAEAFARPTSVGGPLGAQFVAGASGGILGGMATGGPLGAFIGAPAGFLTFSPAAMVKITPWVARGGRVLRTRAHALATRTSPLISTEMQAAAAVSLQGIARSQYGKVLVENEVPTKQKKVLLVGQ